MKKVLIIAYYFPPLGWSGVQRTLKFVKYLRNFDWEPTVVTVGKTKFDILDETLEKEIPKDIKIIRIDDVILKNTTDEMRDRLLEYVQTSMNLISDKNLKDEYVGELDNKFNELRELLLLPDGNAIWANNVVKQIMQVIDLSKIDVIFTTSAPYSAHLIGYNIKNTYNIPWVADFRDEWTNNHILSFDKLSLTYRFNRLLEKNIVETADIVTTVSEISTENYINNFKLDESKVITITNGYDEDDFTEIKFNEVKQNDKFTIVFNGTVYPQAPPYALIESINELIKDKRIDSTKIRINFIGIIYDDLKDNIMNIKPLFEIKWSGYMPHKESLRVAATADLLFNNAGANEKCKVSYTGKIFEYLRLNKPILVLSPKGSVLENLLNELDRGVSIEEKNSKDIEIAIENYYTQWKKGNEIKLFEKDVTRYERKELTRKLADIFNKLIE